MEENHNRLFYILAVLVYLVGFGLIFSQIFVLRPKKRDFFRQDEYLAAEMRANESFTR
ncbi:hypothetical protein B14911_22312 [Bacillus sp. NRRL B-14911]|nr:hypothetical protein B14911_22312 [Bacillus sp. NRRL B-14911]